MAPVTTSEPGLFEGLRVLDAGTFIAVPAAATILGDFGAEVIKVEPPGQGDPMRTYHLTPGLPPTEHAYYWSLLARNKKSVALDLKQQPDRESLYRLASTADVFMTNMPLKVRQRLGIGYEDLAPLNERLIYASFTGFGEDGPEKDLAAFDATAWWARSGLMDQVRTAEHHPPARSTAGMGDHMAALAVYGAIVTALYRRLQTGRGGYVSSSLVANGAWSNAVAIHGASVGIPSIYPPERHLALNALANHYLCADGRWLSLAMTGPQQLQCWPAVARILGLEHLIDDPRYATPEARRENVPTLLTLFDDAFITRPSAEWKALLMQAGATLSIVARATDAITDEQMHASGTLVPMPSAGDGAGITVSSPFAIADAPKREAGRPPALGEHTRELLGEADVSATQPTARVASAR